MQLSIITARKVCIIAIWPMAVMSCARRPPTRNREHLQGYRIGASPGLPLIPSDIGELVEECMAGKGFALIENSHECSSDFASAVNRTCYYRDTLLGRLYVRFKR